MLNLRGLSTLFPASNYALILLDQVNQDNGEKINNEHKRARPQALINDQSHFSYP